MLQLFLTLLATCAAQSSHFAGAKTCAACHPKESAQQSATAHAKSLHPAELHPLAAKFSTSWMTRPPSFQLRYTMVGGKLRAQGYDQKNTIDIPVEWAFGAGDQAVTFVTRIDEDWYLEHHHTWYSAISKMAPTAGHDALAPKTLAEAIGLPYKTTDPQTGILGCFECHSTGPVRITADRTLQPTEHGVRCEACHGAGAGHIANPSRKNIDNPKRLSPTALNTACGRCHRPPASNGAAIDWNYAWNVRHQPVYLSQSACFTKSKGKLSCLTCHDPHTPLNRSLASYNQRCAACHAKPKHSAGEARTNCVDCHMPAVTPQPPLRFTNHWIGVYGNGAKLRPR
ncbi:MAG: hypothetical protein JST93_22485 [Acidobacteria bacterium]|nr:hypothetical protein [Acidobacteriota bacterium]